MQAKITHIVWTVLATVLLTPAVALGAPAWKSCGGAEAWKTADADGDYPYLVFFHTRNKSSADARKLLSAPQVDAAIRGTTCFAIELKKKDAGAFMTQAIGGDAKAPALFVVNAATRYERVDLSQDADAVAEALKPLKMTAAEVLAFYKEQQADPTRVESEEGWSLMLPPHWKAGEDKNSYVGPFEKNTFPDNINVVKTPPQAPPKPTRQTRDGVQKQIQSSLATYKLRNLSTRKYGDKDALLIDGQFVSDGRNVSMYQAVFSGLVVTCTIDSAREEKVWPQCEDIFKSVEISK